MFESPMLEPKAAATGKRLFLTGLGGAPPPAFDEAAADKLPDVDRLAEPLPNDAHTAAAAGIKLCAALLPSDRRSPRSPRLPRSPCSPCSPRPPSPLQPPLSPVAQAPKTSPLLSPRQSPFRAALAASAGPSSAVGSKGARRRTQERGEASNDSDADEADGGPPAPHCRAPLISPKAPRSSALARSPRSPAEAPPRPRLSGWEVLLFGDGLGDVLREIVSYFINPSGYESSAEAAHKLSLTCPAAAKESMSRKDLLALSSACRAMAHAADGAFAALLLPRGAVSCRPLPPPPLAGDKPTPSLVDAPLFKSLVASRPGLGTFVARPERRRRAFSACDGLGRSSLDALYGHPVFCVRYRGIRQGHVLYPASDASALSVPRGIKTMPSNSTVATRAGRCASAATGCWPLQLHTYFKMRTYTKFERLMGVYAGRSHLPLQWLDFEVTDRLYGRIDPSDDTLVTNNGRPPLLPQGGKILPSHSLWTLGIEPGTGGRTEEDDADIDNNPEEVAAAANLEVAAAAAALATATTVAPAVASGTVADAPIAQATSTGATTESPPAESAAALDNDDGGNDYNSTLPDFEADDFESDNDELAPLATPEEPPWTPPTPVGAPTPAMVAAAVAAAAAAAAAEPPAGGADESSDEDVWVDSYLSCAADEVFVCFRDKRATAETPHAITTSLPRLGPSGPDAGEGALKGDGSDGGASGACGRFAAGDGGSELPAVTSDADPGQPVRPPHRGWLFRVKASEPLAALLARVTTEVGGDDAGAGGGSMSDDGDGVAAGAVRFVAVAPQFGSGGAAPARPSDTPLDATARAALGMGHEADVSGVGAASGLATPLHIIEVHDLLASL